jgi:anti-sigma28 factor (negative regulator of flagellin synthesis)
MENAALKKTACDCLVEREVKTQRRKRSVTTLKLDWLAERIRKCKRIKEAVEDGSYNVDSHDVAKAIIRYKHI